MEDILAVTLIFGGGAAFLLAISPIGKAIAYRIKRIGAADGEMVEVPTVTEQNWRFHQIGDQLTNK